MSTGQSGGERPGANLRAKSETTEVHGHRDTETQSVFKVLPFEMKPLCLGGSVARSFDYKYLSKCNYYKFA